MVNNSKMVRCKNCGIYFNAQVRPGDIHCQDCAEEPIEVLIAQLLESSLSQIDFRWEHLTSTEKAIITTPELLKEVQKWMSRRSD